MTTMSHFRMLYKCTWDDGDLVSFVVARSQQDAMAILAELGPVHPSNVEVVDHKAHFVVSFRACRDEHDMPGEIDPHWHATDDYSQDLETVLGDPLPLEPPAAPSLPPHDDDDDAPPCAKCGHARFASVHHPAYEKPNKCDYEAPAQVEPSSADAPAASE